MMRNSFLHVLNGWERDTTRELTNRLKKLEGFVPLEEDEVEAADAVFKVWILRLDALSQAEVEALDEENMKKPSPEKEAARLRKKEAKRAKAEAWHKADKVLTVATIIAALIVGFILGWMASMTDIWWVFQ